MKHTILTITFILALFQFGTTQEFNKEKLDSFFVALDENERFMGSVAIAKDGEVIYTNSIGYIDLENKIKPDANTKYRVGSISKTFTTVLVFKAIEEKKLKLNTKLKKFYPEIKNSNKITIEHLLHHRSGIFNFTNGEDYFDWNTEVKSEKEMLDIIVKGGNTSKPDEQFEYSNSNFVLLSFILEKVYNKSLGELLNEKIIQPLNLEYTAAGGKIDVSDNQALSFVHKRSWVKEVETDASITLGAGAFISSPSDLIKFSKALFEGKLISEENLKKMQTLKGGFGMGMFMVPYYTYMGWGHTGGVDGFSSVFGYYPKEDVAFAITSNGSRFNMNDISLALLGAVFNRSFDIPEFSNYEVSDDELDAYLGEYLNKQYDLEFSITKKDGLLYGQLESQPAIDFEAIDKDKFEQRTVGAVLLFDVRQKTLTLLQAGQSIKFEKQD